MDTSLIKHVKPNPGKRGRDKEILQSKGGIKESIGQRKDEGEEVKLPRRGQTTSHGSKVGDPCIQR